MTPPTTLNPIIITSNFDPEHTHHFNSLGAGVQSTTMHIMAGLGLIKPMPIASIFADTGWEPTQVYRHLEWLESLALPIPIIRVTAGNLFENTWHARRSQGGGKTPYTDLPTVVLKPDGSKSMRTRQCTQNYKIKPIIKEIQRLAGRKPGTKAQNPPWAVQWIGISTDEWMRCKDARTPWIHNAYPLIEAGLSRKDCLTWFNDHYPDRPLIKSSCVGCPYHSDRDWLRLALTEPELIADTISLDQHLRTETRINTENKGQPQFLHASGIPLKKVIDRLKYLHLHQPRLIDEKDTFTEECEGHCGV